MYQIKPENMTTTVKWAEEGTLAKARETAKFAVSSALGEPARAGIYRDDECMEVWEDGKRIWRNEFFRQARYESRQRAKGHRTISVRLDAESLAALETKSAQHGGDQSAAIRALLLR